jgi:hypothetical protein
MQPPSEDIKDMIVAESSLGLTFGTDLFIGFEHADPDNCVVIFDTYGGPPQLTADNAKYYYPSIQILVRNRDYLTGMALIQNIVDTLHGRAHETWNGTLYSLIRCASDPALLGWDDSRRARFVTNFNIQRR